MDLITMKSLIGVQPDDLERIQGIPLLVNVNTQGMKVIEWIVQNKAAIEGLVQTNGALLIRGLKIISSKQFGKVLEALFDGPYLIILIVQPREHNSMAMFILQLNIMPVRR